MISDRDELAKLIEAFGLDIPTNLGILHELVESVGADLDDVIAILDEPSALWATRVVAWAEMLGLISPTKEHGYNVDPVVARVLGAMRTNA